MGKLLNNPTELLLETPSKKLVLAQGTENGDMVVVDTSEINVSNGDLYNLGFYWDETNQIPNDGNADILLQVQEQLHLSGSVIGDGDTEIEFRENVTWSNVGTALTIINKNRNLPVTILSTFAHTPTITGLGVLLVRTYSPGGTKEKTFGSLTSGGDGAFILKPGIDYLLRAINKSNANQRTAISLAVVPHTPL